MVASGCAALRRAWGVALKVRRKLRRIRWRPSNRSVTAVAGYIDVGQQLNRQRFAKVLLCEGQRNLNAIGFGIELQHCGMLRLTAGATMMHDKHPRGALRCLLAQVAFNETEREINPSRHPSGRPHGPVCNEDSIHFDGYLGEPPAEFFGVRPVRGRASAIQNSRFRQREGSYAYRGDPPCRRYRVAQKRHRTW